MGIRSGMRHSFVADYKHESCSLCIGVVDYWWKQSLLSFLVNYLKNLKTSKGG